MHDTLVFISSNRVLPEMMEIEFVTDLFEPPQIRIITSSDGWKEQSTTHIFDKTDEAGEFVDRLVSDLEHRGFIPQYEHRQRAAIVRRTRDDLDRLLCLVETLSVSAPRWATTVDTELTLARLSALVRGTRSARGGEEDGQLNLFDQEYDLIETFYGYVAEVAAEIASVLMPHQAIRGRARKHFIQQFSRRSGRGVTRLTNNLRETLSWSLYSVMDRDTRTFAAVRRMARRRILTLGDLVALSEREAQKAARADFATWLRIRGKLTALGLSFSLEGEHISKSSAAIRYLFSAA